MLFSRFVLKTGVTAFKLLLNIAFDFTFEASKVYVAFFSWQSLICCNRGIVEALLDFLIVCRKESKRLLVLGDSQSNTLSI